MLATARFAALLLVGASAAENKCTDEGRFQLSGGNTDSGRLEVCNGGQWGTICSSEWGFNEAKVPLAYSIDHATHHAILHAYAHIHPYIPPQVACRQLGYADAFMAHKPGGGHGPIWCVKFCPCTLAPLTCVCINRYSSVKCTGEETLLAECALQLHSDAANGCTHSGKWHPLHTNKRGLFAIVPTAPPSPPPTSPLPILLKHLFPPFPPPPSFSRRCGGSVRA
jgi:hypothetical protein